MTTPPSTPETPHDQPIPADTTASQPGPAATPAPAAASPAQPAPQSDPTAFPVYPSTPDPNAAYPNAAYPNAQTYPAQSSPGAAATAPARPKNTLGLVALIIAIATLVLSTVTLVTQAAMMLQPNYNYVLVNLVTTVFTSIGGLLALAAVVLGAIGLAKKGAPKGAAGIGLGIGVATIWAILGNLIYSGILSIVYG
ncbi:hypothetical protein IF188_14840 [Microbacterium sp. NEAU-LLC]|uniref:DUF4190 domain-containing protein n=1 Tax=Microbacterium helvum TaxID=2773713 RepID=A0ABR8NQQ7_9MICO|nr:hypothetical protein [Microbacterium helvum]MBD3942969.1 hypothetical protein [Microbacterium helvum]